MLFLQSLNYAQIFFKKTQVSATNQPIKPVKYFLEPDHKTFPDCPTKKKPFWAIILATLIYSMRLSSAFAQLTNIHKLTVSLGSNIHKFTTPFVLAASPVVCWYYKLLANFSLQTFSKALSVPE